MWLWTPNRATFMHEIHFTSLEIWREQRTTHKMFQHWNTITTIGNYAFLSNKPCFVKLLTIIACNHLLKANETIESGINTLAMFIYILYINIHRQRSNTRFTLILIKDIANIQRVLDSSQEYAAAEQPKSQDEITADWLFSKDSNFIKSYWRWVLELVSDSQ